MAANESAATKTSATTPTPLTTSATSTTTGNDAATSLPAQLTRGSRARWWRRTGSKRRGFRYDTHDGKAVKDEAAFERIKSLVIPPAWSEVRVSPSPRSALQAIGVDARGRVQRIYHPNFAARQQQKKYGKIERFGELLPSLRRQANRDIELGGLPRERVLAVIIRLINDLYFRIGSEQSVKRYRTYGVTTLRNRHLEIKKNGQLHFNFVGKHHIRHRRLILDKDLATLMHDIKAIGGSRLFNYLDEDGKARPITPRDVNDYIKAATSTEFSAKDFRTWGGSLLGAVELAELGAAETEREAKKNLVTAVKRVAEHLGNTPAVCRSSYIHPTVMERYLEGHTLDEFRTRRTRRQFNRQQPEYLPEEQALLRMLRGTTAEDAKSAKAVQLEVEAEVKNSE